MAPVDAERLRRNIVLYAILAMVMVGVVVAALAVAPLAYRLRDEAQESLRHELTLKMLAGGEVVGRAIGLVQQVTSRTVIRQKLESYNRGEVDLDELRRFTADKLGDALSLSPDMLGVVRVAADGQVVARLGQVTGLGVTGDAGGPISVRLEQGEMGAVLVVQAPIQGRGGQREGVDVVAVDAGSLHAVIDQVRGLRGRTEAALVQVGATSRVVMASDPGFLLDDPTLALTAAARTQGDVRMANVGDVVHAAATLPGTDWVMVLKLPSREVTADVDRLVLWVGVAVLAAVGLGVLGLVKVLRPLTGVFIVQAADMNRQIAEMQKTQSELAAKSHDLALSNAELQEYAYAASHDLQEPVRTIISFAQLLARRYRGQMGAEADEFIGFIIDGAERMRRQINDLLSYARLGRGEQVSEVVELDQVATEARQALSAAIDESKAEIRIAALPPVTGNREALSRLLQNLVGNALKFAKPGIPPHVEIDADVTDNWVHVRISDQGIGMAPEYHERVFRMFERLHAGSHYAGSGIGLAICRKVVEMHGGRIWIESQLGQGCTFHILLPGA
ncbi:MAG: hypothetical protein LDL39_14580 [Magnetospirillum sp.]|nr:hypothetical protein [Magnetospirillum sp.]